MYYFSISIREFLTFYRDFLIKTWLVVIFIRGLTKGEVIGELDTPSKAKRFDQIVRAVCALLLYEPSVCK